VQPWLANVRGKGAVIKKKIRVADTKHHWNFNFHGKGMIENEQEKSSFFSNSFDFEHDRFHYYYDP
jgi:hypothetical protein